MSQLKTTLLFLTRILKFKAAKNLLFISMQALDLFKFKTALDAQYLFLLFKKWFQLINVKKLLSQLQAILLESEIQLTLQ